MIEALLSALIRYDENLLYNGDLTGFIASIYTPFLGQFFGGIILLVIFALTYIRTNEIIYGAVLWILLSGSFEVLIPTAGFSVGKLFLVLGIASALFSLFTKSRRQSGY